MDDTKIVALYWNRDSTAIAASDQKYGNYLNSIAMNILNSCEDSQECVNDTYFHAWNAMPPHRPAVLRTFLGKITRNLAFNRWKKEQAEKRGGGELVCALDELAECVSGSEDTETAYDRKLLLDAIDAFLLAQPKDRRGIFLSRYWYADSIGVIAKRFALTEGNVSMILSRMRKKLRQHLQERGFDL